MKLNNDLSDLISKVKKMEKGEKFDLSSGEDLSIAIMNLISLEEHFFFSYQKTKDEKYMELLSQIREMRKSALKQIIKEYEGEVWCISKHLLAASMRFMEVGTKMQTKGDKEAAKDMFKKSYDLYSLFWGLNLGVVTSSQLPEIENNKKSNRNGKKDGENEIQYLAESKIPVVKSGGTIFDKLGELVQKAIDCCRE